MVQKSRVESQSDERHTADVAEVAVGVSPLANTTG